MSLSGADGAENAGPCQAVDLQHQVFSVQTIRNETFTTRGQAFMRKKGIKTLELLLIRGTGSEERKGDDGKGRPESEHRLHLHTWLRW